MSSTGPNDFDTEYETGLIEACIEEAGDLYFTITCDDQPFFENVPED